MIYAIIPVHNRLNLTKACVSSLLIQKNCEKIKIIIINDGSTDGTKKYFTKNSSNSTVLNGDGSLFWGGAVSKGINYVLDNNPKKNDWILLVNNDVVLTENTVSELISLSKSKKRKALVSALTLSNIDKKTIIKSGTIIKSWFFNKMNHLFKGIKVNEINNINYVEIDLFTGRCLLHPIEIFKKIGNYDSKMFQHYGGDDEFSIRAKRNGYLNLLCLKSIVFLKTKKIKKSRKLSFKNLIYLFFNKKSSANLLDKFKITLKIVPLYAKISFFLIGILKTLYIFFKNEY